MDYLEKKMRRNLSEINSLFERDYSEIIGDTFQSIPVGLKNAYDSLSNDLNTKETGLNKVGTLGSSPFRALLKGTGSAANMITSGKVSPNNLPDPIKTDRDGGILAKISSGISDAGSFASSAAIGAAGLGGAALVGYVLKNLYDKYNYSTNGCANITDPEKKRDCKLYVLDKTINTLQSSLSFCHGQDDETNCKEMVYNEIDKLMNEKNNITKYMMY